MTSKAKTRLNMGRREEMLDFAQANIIADSKLQKAYDAAYKKAEKLVRAGLEKKHPESEMKVLRKYEMTKPDDCIQVKLAEGSSEFEQFTFQGEEDEDGCVIGSPEVPDTYCYNRVYWLGVNCGKAVAAYRKACDELCEANTQARRDFKALIWNAKTFEEAVEAWPKFAEISELICKQSTALTTLSDDTKKRIAGYKVAA